VYCPAMKLLALITLLVLTVPVLGGLETSGDAAKVELDEEQINKYFQQMDGDKNGRLDVEELPKWVRKMVDVHIKESVPTAKDEFRAVDTNRDKIITWEEYRVMMQKLGNQDPEHVVYSDKEQKHKFRTADENGDGVLNQIEYVAFKNPMTTDYVLTRIAQELLEDFDKDKDNKVSMSEFVHHEASRVDDKGDKEIDKLRRIEFRASIDRNDDKFLDLGEMKDYLNPRGKNFVTNEARLMMHEADANNDKQLSLKEIKDNYLHFQHHKNNPVIRAIHDEF